MPGASTPTASAPRRESDGWRDASCQLSPWILGLSACLLLPIGCSLDVEGPQSTLWEGRLEATGEDPALTGSAAAVSRRTTARVGVEVTGGEVGDRWRWAVREGSCDSPGPLLGSSDAYPVIEAEEETDPEAPVPVARASGQTTLPTTLDSDREYHATVAADSAPETHLACGDLSLQ